MKVYVKPPSHLSKAMFRVARALKRYAPDDVEIVNDVRTCDMQVLHVIGTDALALKLDRPYIVIQYCYHGLCAGVEDWRKFWDPAVLVWSYYDLPAGPNFYNSPLGIDEEFRKPFFSTPRRSVISSGYVTGPGAEAINEVAIAAGMTGLPVEHLGPLPAGMSKMGHWTSILGIDDYGLAERYRSARWVSGLRYVEGFELPVIEGLACGARPVCFDRPDMRKWYNQHAVFVPELTGGPLIDKLVEVFNCAPEPVTRAEREVILEKFSWDNIASKFWEQIVERMASV